MTNIISCRRIDARSGVGDASPSEFSATNAKIGNAKSTEEYRKGCDSARSAGRSSAGRKKRAKDAMVSNKRKLLANDLPCPKIGLKLSAATYGKNDWLKAKRPWRLPRPGIIAKE